MLNLIRFRRTVRFICSVRDLHWVIVWGKAALRSSFLSLINSYQGFCSFAGLSHLTADKITA